MKVMKAPSDWTTSLENARQGLALLDDDAIHVGRVRNAERGHVRQVGLFVGVAGEDGVARFRVNTDEVGRLRALARAVK